MAGENTARDYSNDLDQARNGVESPSNFHVPQNTKAADDSIKYDDKNENQDSHAERLENARSDNDKSKHDDGSAKEILDTAKNIAENANPLGALSLLKQIDFLGDMPYVAALGAALLKDLLDLATFETVIIPILFSALCSIFIFMMMLLVSSGGKRKKATAIFKKIMYLIGGGIADSIPGINFLPVETCVVGIIYVMTLMERKSAAKEK